MTPNQEGDLAVIEGHWQANAFRHGRAFTSMFHTLALFLFAGTAAVVLLAATLRAVVFLMNARMLSRIVSMKAGCGWNARWRVSWRGWRPRFVFRLMDDEGATRFEDEYSPISLRLHGASRQWADGKKMGESFFRHGMLHGSCRRWHPNGILERECRFRRGRKDGVERVFDRDGRLSREIVHDASEDDSPDQ